MYTKVCVNTCRVFLVKFSCTTASEMIDSISVLFQKPFTYKWAFGAGVYNSHIHNICSICMKIVCTCTCICTCTCACTFCACYHFCCVVAALQVVLLDVDSASNAAVCDEITNKSQVAHAYTCDLSDKDAIYETAAKVWFCPVLYMYMSECVKSDVHVHCLCLSGHLFLLYSTALNKLVCTV